MIGVNFTMREVKMNLSGENMSKVEVTDIIKMFEQHGVHRIEIGKSGNALKDFGHGFVGTRRWKRLSIKI